LARMSTPRSILSRASTPNLTSLADILIHSIGDPRPAKTRPKGAAENEERFGD
jgi:hypothetical protein